MSEIYEIADATKADLIAAAFNAGPPPLFVPVRVYVPIVELEAMDQLSVIVMAAADDVTQYSRQSNWESIDVEIGVLQHLAGVDGTDPANNNKIDPLVKLCRLIAIMYSAGNHAGVIAGTPTAGLWMGSKYPVICDSERLRQGNVFQAVIKHTFKQAP